MSNSYKEMVDIMPKSERTWVGTVMSKDTAKGTSTVKLLTGDWVTVSGTEVDLGKNVLVVNGRITQTLPNLTAYAVTIY